MFLPITKEEMKQRGWEEVDFVLVTGDAYVDHHSFGTAIIGRLLESRGYKVAVLPRPDYKSAEDFRRFGKPRLGFRYQALLAFRLTLFFPEESPLCRLNGKCISLEMPESFRI